jgi:hypothetical protein
MAYYDFDILYLDGFDLRAAPLVERKRMLAGLLKEAGDIGPLFVSDHFDDGAATLFDRSCEMGLEGIVSKLRNAPYKSGRTEHWIKVKCLQVARYEVVGYKNGATSLYLARRQGKELLYVGKAGTGFTNTIDPGAGASAEADHAGEISALEDARPQEQDRQMGRAEILGPGRVSRHHNRRAAAPCHIQGPVRKPGCKEAARCQVQDIGAAPCVLMPQPLPALTAKACRDQAANCRETAKATMTRPQRVMLEHIADT